MRPLLSADGAPRSALVFIYGRRQCVRSCHGMAPGDAVAPRFDRIDTTDGKVAVIRNPAPSVREKRGRQIKDDPKAGRVCIWADEVAQCNRIVLHSALVFALRSC